MDRKVDDRNTGEGQISVDIDLKQNSNKSEMVVDISVNEKNEESGEDKKEDEEEDEEEEEEEEDRIIEKSPNLRFHKRNKKYMRKVPGIDSSYIAIEPKSGKEVFWNEINLADKKTEQENRFISLIKKLKRYNHPFFVRYLDVWSSKGEGNSRKIIFVTERLTDPTMKQYFVNSSSTHRLTNKALWRKFVGQLMSVIKFLNHLGVNHGNLSNEAVYYQNTGCLKVGTLAVDLNFDNKPSNDIYDMGKLALEMAAYEATDDTENLSTEDRIQKMLTRVTDPLQASFIQTCLDNSESPTTLNKLFQHTVLKEVPSLKRLAAKVIVINTAAAHEDGKTEEKTESQYFTEISNILKDQVSHFEEETVLFRVVFKKDSITKWRLWKEFRINFSNLTKYIEDVKNGFYPIFEGKGSQYQDDSEEITFSYSLDHEFSKDHTPNLYSKDSNSSQVADNELAKEATNSKLSNDQNQDLQKHNKLETFSGISKETSDLPLSLDHKNEKLEKTPNISKEFLTSSEIKLPDAGSNETNNLVGTQEEIKNEGYGTQLQEVTESLDGMDNDDDDEDDDDDDDDQTGFRSGQSSSAMGLSDGRSDHQQPYWEWVPAPNRPPADRALFTGCRYSYIGCGRWQLYVQVWFLEDRLKREVLMQLCEHEWSRGDTHVTELFERAHVILPDDRVILQRILSYARHNCPLVDGELIPPSIKLANFDAYDLYQRLEHLQMFSKAQQLLEQAENEKNKVVINMTTPSPVTNTTNASPDVNVPNPTRGPTSAPTPKEANVSQSSNSFIPSSITTTSTEQKPIKQTDKPINNISIENKSTILKGVKIGELPGFKIDAMDIRILAPLNSSCMYCDRHEYLHVIELPAFLSSPCYHCRETLAREAKISPTALFDLHQQNFIPWPAFLQVRFNIPPVEDGRSLKQLIEYDCKWRGRSPCRCLLVPSDETTEPSGINNESVNGLMPPCVEFPNLYGDESQQNHLNCNPDNCDPKNIPLLNQEDSKPSTSSNTKITPPHQRPCSNRHSKGATMKCLHGFTFPHTQQNNQPILSSVPPLSPTSSLNPNEFLGNTNNTGFVNSSITTAVTNTISSTAIIISNNPTTINNSTNPNTINTAPNILPSVISSK